MALTQDQINAARDFINKQWGGSYDSTGQFQQGSAFNANGQYNFNPMDTLKNTSILGAGAAYGYSNDDMAQILGYSPDQVAQYSSSHQPNVNIEKNIATGDFNSGFYNTGSVTPPPLQNTVNNLTTGPNATPQNRSQLPGNPAANSNTGNPYGVPTPKAPNGSTVQTYLPLNGGGNTTPTPVNPPPVQTNPNGTFNYNGQTYQNNNNTTQSYSGTDSVGAGGFHTAQNSSPFSIAGSPMVSAGANPNAGNQSGSSVPDNQTIANYWNQNQGNLGALTSAMQQYGVTPQMVADATGSSLNSVDSILGGGMGNLNGSDFNNIKSQLTTPTTVNAGGGDTSQGPPPSQITYNGNNFVSDGNGGYWGWKDNSAWDNGNNIANYNGTTVTKYDGNGNVIGTGKLSGITNDNLMQDIAPFIMVGAGFGASLAGLGTFGAGLQNAVNFGTNPVLDTTAGATTSGGVTSAVDGTFNAAKDSQAANEALNLPPVTDPTTTGVPVPPDANGPLPTTTPTTPPVTPPTTTGPTIPKIPPVIPPTGGGPTGGGPTTTTPGGLTLGNIMTLLGGLWDSNKQSQASNDMLNYLKSQQAKIDNLYAPGSPEANYLWDAMSRKDAAAGRNSQYGPRSVDLAAKIAQVKADETAKMTMGTGALYAAALNKGASSDSSILSALGNLTGNGSGLGGMSLSDITNWLQKQFGGTTDLNSWIPDTSSPDLSQNYQPDGGDLGQYF